MKIPKILAIGLMMTANATPPDYETAAKNATCTTPKAIECLQPPTVDPKNYTVKSPFGTRNDEFYWLRDDTRKNPEMLQYLRAENAYADAVMRPLAATKQKIFDEIVSRIKQDDSSIPYRDHGFWYYARYENGSDYPIYARRKDGDGVNALTIQEKNNANDFAGEEILLNVNTLAKGHDYYAAFITDISIDNQKIIWAHDTNGRRQYTLQILDLRTGENSNLVQNTTGNAVFVDGDRAFLYIEKDKKTLLGNTVKRHVLGSSAADESVYVERDDTFYLGLDVTRDEKFVTIHSSSTISDEMRYAPLSDAKNFKTLSPRARGLEYSADHHNDRWFIRTNADEAKNFKIMTAPSDATSKAAWRDEIAYDDAVFIDDFALFDDFMAIAERSNGLNRIRILKDGKSRYVDADESAYNMGLSNNSEPNTHMLRYGYESMTTPAIVYELDVETGARTQLKQTPVPNYDASKYATERIWVTARDGVKVPVSLVYKKDFMRDGTSALLLYAYGSYGSSTDPYFSASRVSLLDRGMVFAIAHVRGGQEMGRAWYDDGKMFHKKNTFNDFIDVTRALVAQKYAAKNRVAAMGGSAGGLLMGVVANEAPEDYRVIIAQVPFVDVVTTMLDASIPLTTGEYDEWGNPEKSHESYEYMLSYSPYDNIRAQAYPAMFVGTGLWDSQVQYYEPTKYVARLRAKNTGALPIVLRTNMEAGHGGKSGRFDRFKETAEIYAFLLRELGVDEK